MNDFDVVNKIKVEKNLSMVDHHTQWNVSKQKISIKLNEEKTIQLFMYE